MARAGEGKGGAAEPKGPGCPSSKRRFEQEDEAWRQAREGMLFKGAPALSVYFCLLCMGWHLTSSARGPARAKRRR